MGSAYFESILVIERLHRQFLEVFKVALDVGGVTDINNVQALEPPSIFLDTNLGLNRVRKKSR